MILCTCYNDKPKDATLYDAAITLVTIIMEAVQV